MASIIKSLTDGLKSLLKVDAKLKPISKDDFREYIFLTLNGLKSFNGSIVGLTPSDQKELAATISGLSKDKNKAGIKIYNDYKSKLRGSAAAEEAKMTFESFKKTSLVISDVLEKVEKDLDELFENKAITIYNTTMTQAVIFGILREAEVFSKFAIYITNAITVDINAGMGTVPKYRTQFLTDNTQMAANIANRVYAKSGLYNYDVAIENLKKTNNNLVLVDADDPQKFANISMLQVNKINASTQLLIQNSIPEFNIFKWFGEYWTTVQHKRYLKNKSEKEWLEAHISLLKLEMEKASETDKAKLEQIIEAYNKQLTKLDKEIDSYLDS